MTGHWDQCPFAFEGLVDLIEFGIYCSRNLLELEVGKLLIQAPFPPLL
ncbi:MAG: hypothetical protein WBO06_02410 [Gammaproteobacteria bacterium]